MFRRENKKAPVVNRGKIDLDYGMMFSGQGENGATITPKDAVLMKKSWRK